MNRQIENSRVIAETPTQLVLYRQREGQIVLANRNASQKAIQGMAVVLDGTRENGPASSATGSSSTPLTESCPACGKSIHNDDSETPRERSLAPPATTTRIVDGNYFSILEDLLNSSSFNQGYYDRFFVELNKLGRGQRGSVFRVRHMLDKIDLGEFAVKAVPTGSSHSWLVKMLREVMLLGKLKHPNVGKVLKGRDYGEYG